MCDLVLLQLVRFTPPRELTPPPLRHAADAVQSSYQTLTLGGASDATPVENGLTNGYVEEDCVAPPIVKSAAKISLRTA